MPLITFVIPVRHQDNARDWPSLKANLAQTVASIANQTHGDWRGIVVANEGADLPPLPRKFSIVRVDFPPNDLHEFEQASKDEVYEAFRADKGRRVLAGMLAAGDSTFFMISDDDDLVSARLVQYIAGHPRENGWTIDRGFIWNSGGSVLLGYEEFSRLCGTSLIVRSDLYRLPHRFEDAELDWIKTMLGSHVRIAGILADRGTPLQSLPFPGAVYRVAHTGSHSRAPNLLTTYFLNRQTLRHPKRLLRNLRNLRWIGAGERREFFGEAGSPGLWSAARNRLAGSEAGNG